MNDTMRTCYKMEGKFIMYNKFTLPLGLANGDPLKNKSKKYEMGMTVVTFMAWSR